MGVAQLLRLKASQLSVNSIRSKRIDLVLQVLHGLGFRQYGCGDLGDLRIRTCLERLCIVHFAHKRIYEFENERSEERRVGKECRSWGRQDAEQQQRYGRTGRAVWTSVHCA